MRFSELNKKSESESDIKKFKQEPTIKPIELINLKEKEETKNIDTNDKKPEKEILEDSKAPVDKPQKEPEIKFSIPKKEIKKTDFSPFLAREKELKEKANVIYSKAVLMMKEFYSELGNSYIEKYAELRYLIDQIYEQLKENPFFPIVLKYLTPADYLISHSINVSIISMGVAKNLNLEENTIKKIGISALLLDIGMRDYISLVRQERKLNDTEMEMIKNHVQIGIEKLNNIVDLEFEIKAFAADILSKVHERYDGSGYPLGIAGEKIDLYSQILAVADVYEAMTHKRPWRNAYEPPVIMRQFLSDFKESFHPKALKGIILFLSMYPPNSIVRLSTGEIGIVELMNSEKFARPIVKIVMDSEFRNVENFFIDLMEYPLTQIENEIKYKELAEKNIKFLIDYEMSSLWIDW